MKYLLFNWEEIEKSINDPSDLSDKEFEKLAIDHGHIYNNAEDFKASFNAEIFSVHTHQLRIIEEPQLKPKVLIVVEGGFVQQTLTDVESEIMIIDYDVNGNCGNDITVSIPQTNGKNAEAYVSDVFFNEANPDRVNKLFNLKATKS